MTASRPSYEVSLINDKHSRWANDKSQKHCYVCTKVKLSKGKRHHCRLCGNISCKGCCPRICKKCLAENIASTSSSSQSMSYEPIQRLCKLKSQQIRWKKVTMIDKVYYEPVYIINEDSTNICIIRTVDGDYYASDKNILYPAPQKENILDSLQCLLHGFINRSSESSISLKKPLYALQENDNVLMHESVQRKYSKTTKRDIYGGDNEKILKRCNIFSFFPMLQQDSYKLEGFIFKSSLTKMNINNVQLFHYVSDDESPKKIPAFTPKTVIHRNNDEEKKINVANNNTEVIISANSRRKSASLSNLKTKNMAVLELELESFKKGYQEMRKMYEEYVSANEVKWTETNKRLKENDETIERLQKEVENLTQSKAKYKQAVDINANQVRELQKQLKELSIEYQQKLDSQSNKYKDSTQKTTNDAQSQLIESYKNLEEANGKISKLTQEIEALKTTKSTNTMDQINQFRLEKEQKRSNDLEIQLKDRNLELEEAKLKIDELSQFGMTSKPDYKTSIVIETVKDKIASEYDELFNIEHKELFDLLFNLIKSYRSTWNEEYLYPLIYELLFKILICCYNLINKYEKNVSLTLCKEFSINKDILYESFYNEWIKNSNYEIFLHSTDKINEIKTYVTDTMFIKDFIYKHLELNGHQISEEIHLKFASFIKKCINISWKMCIQHPLLRYTPNTFNVEQLNKIKYHKDLHNVYNNNNDHQFILYYIWPIISHNNFHPIVDSMKIAVCLGHTLPNKININNEMKDNMDNNNDNDNNINPDGNEDDNGNNHNDEDDSIGMIIFNHNDNDNYNNHIGDDDSYYDHHLHDEYE